MTEWKYPGDEVVRLAFTANVLEVIKEKNLTPEEVEQRIAAAYKTIDHRLHERAFGRTVRKLREEHNMSRKTLAALAKIPPSNAAVHPAASRVRQLPLPAPDFVPSKK